MTDTEPAPITTEISVEHLAELGKAKQRLENPSLAARISSAVGSPLEKSIQLLPAQAKTAINDITVRSLEAALKVAMTTLQQTGKPPADKWHRASVAISGALGGAFGLPALALELPVSTTMILRSIADIAQSEGEELRRERARLACLEVFALGGAGTHDDATDAGYFAIRASLAKAVTDAAKHLAASGLSRHSTPPVTRLISQLAARFSVPVSEKFAAQAMPIVGAAGGALINTVFIHHYQAMAHGHFVVRRLERLYGHEPIKEAYRAV